MLRTYTVLYTVVTCLQSSVDGGGGAGAGLHGREARGVHVQAAEHAVGVHGVGLGAGRDDGLVGQVLAVQLRVVALLGRGEVAQVDGAGVRVVHVGGVEGGVRGEQPASGGAVGGGGVARDGGPLGSGHHAGELAAGAHDARAAPHLLIHADVAVQVEALEVVLGHARGAIVRGDASVGAAEAPGVVERRDVEGVQPPVGGGGGAGGVARLEPVEGVRGGLGVQVLNDRAVLEAVDQELGLLVLQLGVGAHPRVGVEQRLGHQHLPDLDLAGPRPLGHGALSEAVPLLADGQVVRGVVGLVHHGAGAHGGAVHLGDGERPGVALGEVHGLGDVVPLGHVAAVEVRRGAGGLALGLAGAEVGGV
mmetsp:Transcript_6170/g.15735  ORF Transcript_6170/g.15735 Transcript_6170/m.15735 type:complete len:363 (-) Transcript_6170:1859-2947(-)